MENHKEQKCLAEMIMANTKTNWENLLNHYLKAFKDKKLSESQEKQLKWMIQIDYMFRYFAVAILYLEKNDIQKRVEEEYPLWTGYENQFWIFYHYEAYCNFLYTYQQALGSFLREFFSINKKATLSKIAEDPRLRSIIINQKTKENAGDLIAAFANNQIIKAMIDERGEGIHEYGLWRFRHKEPHMQRWDEFIKKMADKIRNANKIIGSFHDKISVLILQQFDSTFLLVWSGKKWDWTDLSEKKREVQEKGYTIFPYSCGNNKSISLGDRVFFIRLGGEPRGIFALGTVVKERYEKEHWDKKENRRIGYIDIRVNSLLEPGVDRILPISFLKKGRLGEMHWESQASGIKIPQDIADEVEKEFNQIGENSASSEFYEKT